ncbi:MAG: metallophosphoesterase [Helicobacteraceae bacterium]|nr:metallophosphoesterase [Helicobacteraceae bacterium]
MSKFSIVMTVVYSAMAFGICFCMIRPIATRKIVKIAAYAIVVLCAAMAISYMHLRRAELLPSYFEDLFALMVGAVFTLFMAALLSDWAIRVARRAYKSDRFDNKMRIGALVVSFAYLAYGFFSATTAPNIKEVTIETTRVKAPLTIAHLTDLHLGNGALLNQSFAARIKEQVEALKPDIIVITGDLVDARLNKIKLALREIAKTKSKYGIYFASGNHENYSNAIEAMDYLDSLGIEVLRNESVRISGDFGEIDIAGILDYSGKRLGFLLPDAKKTLKDVKADNFVVVLAHQPISINDFEPQSFDLMLNGHTHGGQIFPFNLLVRFAQPYLAGLYQHDDRAKVYVSRGVGYWGPPLRMFAPNEIAFITIKPPLV